MYTGRTGSIVELSSALKAMAEWMVWLGRCGAGDEGVVGIEIGIGIP